MYRSASQISFDTVYYPTSAYYPAPAAAVVPHHSRYPFGVDANAPLYPPGLGFGPSPSSIAMATGFMVYDESSLSAEYDERVEVVEPGKYGAIARPTKPEECRLLVSLVFSINSSGLRLISWYSNQLLVTTAVPTVSATMYSTALAAEHR